MEQIKKNAGNAAPAVSFYSLRSTLNNGDNLDLSVLKGKKVLLVNTASNCGYTAQYGELESLYERYKDKLVVIGFPANDFKEQEKGTDGAIAEFCRVNFGVTFPLMKKSSVVKGSAQNAIFKWLTDESKNGWNSQEPVWNFCKYLVDEQGVLTHYFAMSVSPESPEVVAAVTS
jgi:glutathione peroxidase